MKAMGLELLKIIITSASLMVDKIRKLVSGNRRRISDGDFNLDLTYIIPNRIIAMSYPSHGFEKFYRNPIDDVSKFDAPFASHSI